MLPNHHHQEDRRARARARRDRPCRSLRQANRNQPLWREIHHRHPDHVVRVITPAGGFDWADAGIGAAGGLALSMLAIGGSARHLIPPTRTAPHQPPSADHLTGFPADTRSASRHTRKKPARRRRRRAGLCSIYRRGAPSLRWVRDASRDAQSRSGTSPRRLARSLPRRRSRRVGGTWKRLTARVRRHGCARHPLSTPVGAPHAGTAPSAQSPPSDAAGPDDRIRVPDRDSRAIALATEQPRPDYRTT